MGKSSNTSSSGEKTVSVNKKARFEYQIEVTYEAGIVLTGTEVKAIREGRINLKEGYCKFRNGELWLVDSNISPYTYGNRNNHEPTRPRKLLMHKRELIRLAQKINEKGYALIPMRIYFKQGRAKLAVGLGKGKKLHDKRQDQKAREDKREMERAMKQRY